MVDLCFLLIDNLTMDKQKNVLGEYITECGCQPMTGWYRDGHCHTDIDDHGVHTVCCTVTQEFLEFVKNQGNAKNDIPIALYNNDQLISKRSFSIEQDSQQTINARQPRPRALMQRPSR